MRFEQIPGQIPRPRRHDQLRLDGSGVDPELTHEMPIVAGLVRPDEGTRHGTREQPASHVGRIAPAFRDAGAADQPCGGERVGEEHRHVRTGPAQRGEVAAARAGRREPPRPLHDEHVVRERRHREEPGDGAAGGHDHPCAAKVAPEITHRRQRHDGVAEPVG
jgi:hypothetical protein